jgi:hypothetical protein
VEWKSDRPLELGGKRNPTESLVERREKQGGRKMPWNFPNSFCFTMFLLGIFFGRSRKDGHIFVPCIGWHGRR